MKNLIALSLLLLVGCGTQATCDVTSCATGCCDSNGTCRPGSATSACGKGGATCSSCASSCTEGVCDGASGGGTASTGGGSASTGGGGAANGGGAAATGGGSASSGGGSASSGGGSAAMGGGSAATGGGASGTSGAVVNEIVARGGSEYVELYNPGNTAFDLSGFSVTDSHDDGGPDTDKAVHFAAGTMLDSHAFALIMCGRDAGDVLTTDCAGGTSCWAATWSISNSKGETVWVIDPQAQVSDQAHYPAGGADAGRSYGRLPDGTGAFQETSKTPAAPNMP